MKIRSGLKASIRQLPGFKQLEAYFARNPQNEFLRFAPAGHFYSPIPDLSKIEQDSARLWPSPPPRNLAGIDTREVAQKDLLQSIAEFRESCPFLDPHKTTRYSTENDYFSFPSALLLHGILRCYRPRRVIEVGSGFSSAVMLDTNEFCELEIEQFTFIDPYPDRLLRQLTEADQQRCAIKSCAIQEVPLREFQNLKENDLLFIDSSHVAKTGSDVVHLIQEVFPILAPGVLVHVHDIYWPFEYPLRWIRQGICWNEAYFIRAFLQFNREFEILLFNDFCRLHLREDLDRCFTKQYSDAGSSLYFRRLSN